MNKVTGTYRDGAVVLDTPVDWADGTRIEVIQIDGSETNGSRGPSVRQGLLDALNDPERYGLDESLWPQTPREIQLLLERMDAARPLEMTAEELDAMEKSILAEKERQKAMTRESWSKAEQRFK